MNRLDTCLSAQVSGCPRLEHLRKRLIRSEARQDCGARAAEQPEGMLLTALHTQHTRAGTVSSRCYQATIPTLHLPFT